jgi:hypothetical protein
MSHYCPRARVTVGNIRVLIYINWINPVGRYDLTLIGSWIMTAFDKYSIQIYEMMARLGIEPGAGVLPQMSLRYATALRRCETCRSKKACQDWLDYAPAMVNFAPEFCANADILFDLQYDQTGPRWFN